MEVTRFCLGTNETNCYLVRARDSKTSVVIDPGDRSDFVLAQVAQLGLTVEAVFLTHGHFDHVGAVEPILAQTGCPLWMGDGDRFQQPEWLFPLSRRQLPDVRFFRHGQTLSAAGLSFTLWQTPGHSSGSVCLLCGTSLFSGDTLFAGSIGRTDFPGSNWQEMEASLAFLAEQKTDLTVYPGHGGQTTLFHELKTNPFLG